MRYENIVKYPCPDCGCAMTAIATYCCSKEADLICIKCGTKTITQDEACKILDYHPYIWTSMWDKRMKCFRHILIPKEEQRVPKDKNIPLSYMCTYETESLPEEESAELIQLAQKLGYKPTGPQVGFIGKEDRREDFQKILTSLRRQEQKEQN